MSEDEKPEGQEGQKEEEKLTPVQKLQKKTTRLHKEVTEMENQIRVYGGQVANRDPKLIEQATAMQETQKAKRQKLETALYALMFDSLKPRSQGEVEFQFNLLRKTAVDYMSQVGVDEAVWKDLAY